MSLRLTRSPPRIPDRLDRTTSTTTTQPRVGFRRGYAPRGPDTPLIARAFRETPQGSLQSGVPSGGTPSARPMLRHSRKGSTSWPPLDPIALGLRLHRILASPCAAPPLGRVLRRYGHGPSPGSPGCAPERDPLARHPPCLPQSRLPVHFEKSGKGGGRLLHQESAQWKRLAGGFLLPRERVAGGMVPKYLVGRIEAILRGSPLPARR